MAEPVPATKLELWCERFWRDHGCEIIHLSRELLKTTYRIVDSTGKEIEYAVPIVPTVPMADFKREFELMWGGTNAESEGKSVQQ